MNRHHSTGPWGDNRPDWLLVTGFVAALLIVGTLTGLGFGWLVRWLFGGGCA